MENHQNVYLEGQETVTERKKPPRDVNLDLIRCVALFLVPSLHSLAYMEFYDIPVTGWLMYIMSSIRTMSMMCIPLFLMLTGYLMSKKVYSRKYFKGLIRVWLIFFLCKIVIVIFYDRLYRHSYNTLLDFIKSLTAGGEYSWYVGLYTWMYCLIPLSNIIFNSLDEKWKKQSFLLAVIGILILPTFGNYYKSDMPDIFHALWPFAYYFIGAYAREYHNDDDKGRALVLFLGAVLMSCTISILISKDTPYLRNSLNDWNSFGTAMMSAALFVLLRKLDLRNIPQMAKVILAKVSEWSFGAYLLTWIFDNVFYDKLVDLIPTAIDRLKYYVIIVPMVLVCSLLVSAVVNVVYKYLFALLKAIYKEIKSAV